MGAHRVPWQIHPLPFHQLSTPWGYGALLLAPVLPHPPECKATLLPASACLWLSDALNYARNQQVFHAKEGTNIYMTLI